MQSGVSEATVIRFSRKLGLKGFQDLKLHLAHEVMSGPETIQRMSALVIPLWRYLPKYSQNIGRP